MKWSMTSSNNSSCKTDKLYSGTGAVRIISKTDRGSSFMSRTLKELYELLGIK